MAAEHLKEEQPTIDSNPVAEKGKGSNWRDGHDVVFEFISASGKASAVVEDTGAKQRESQLMANKQILEEELNALGISKFLQDTLAAHNPADNPDKWEKTDIFRYPNASTLRINLYRYSNVRKTRSFPSGYHRDERVVLKFSTPEENQPRTVTITGAEQTFNGEIPNMNDTSNDAKERQQEFKKAIETAIGNPQIRQDMASA